MCVCVFDCVCLCVSARVYVCVYELKYVVIINNISVGRWPAPS